MTQQGTLLIVGASGILAPAAATAQACGLAVTGVSLNNLPGAELSRVVRVDARSVEALDAEFADEYWDYAIVYAPATTPRALEWLKPRVGKRLIVVETSQIADPKTGFTRPEKDTLVLGWYFDSGQEAHWHTATEISDAALRLLAKHTGSVLGTVRPWSSRPRG